MVERNICAKCGKDLEEPAEIQVGRLNKRGNDPIWPPEDLLCKDCAEEYEAWRDGKVITKKHCKRCGHEWYPNSPEKPRICPECKSPYWDREKIQ